MVLFFSLLLLILGFVLLMKGADYFVDGSSAIAQRLGIPQMVIGLTIVAMGTSAPEAAVSITAALKGSADITIGNIIGSNILNILIILGISSIITPLAISKTTLFQDIPFMILVTLLLLAQGLKGTIRFLDGVVLLTVFLSYLIYLYSISKKDRDSTPKAPLQKQAGLLHSVLYSAAGLVLIILGSNASVSAATAIAEIFGMSQRLISLTIVAFGTSLPELFTSVTAARKGSTDIAIGNIVGSNIFNILFVIGISSLFTDISFSSKFYFDSAAAIFSGLLLLICSIRKKKSGPLGGGIMLASYILYFIYACI